MIQTTVNCWDTIGDAQKELAKALGRQEFLVIS